MFSLISDSFLGSFLQVLLSGGVFCFSVSFAFIMYLNDMLPRDGGKEFAVGGEASRGKATGAGIIFVSVFIVTTFLFVKISAETSIYMGIFFLEMLFGFLDDSSRKPWGRLKKGLLDLASAAAGAGTFLYFHGELSGFHWGNRFVSLPKPMYFCLAVLLILVAINVTNCSDGVDGLAGSLFLITVVPMLLLIPGRTESDFFRSICFFMAAVLAYLWFNTNPSSVLMGDAGSRVLGYVIALAAMHSGHPLLYIPFSLMLLLDGGASLFKISMIHLTGKKDFMHTIRTPLHDHARKNKGWPAQQVTQRFIIMQIVITGITVIMFKMACP